MNRCGTVAGVKLILLAAVLAAPAFADIIPDEVALCRGKAAGAPCSVEGQAGTCVETSVSRPDYSSGIPPKYKQVKMLSCVAVAAGSARSVTPWLGAALAFLALLAAFGFKARRPALS